MSDNIIYFNGVTRLDLPPDRVLEEAKGKLEGCLILGYDKEGNEYFAGSTSSKEKAVYLAQRFIKLMVDDE